MNRLLIVTLIGITASLRCVSAHAQDNVGKNDSIATAIRIHALKEKRIRLTQQIAAEDKKRNRVINSVSALNLEQLNDRQDSICLDLRSRLVNVDLEIQELTPIKVPAQVMQQHNTVIHQQPAKPTQQHTPAANQKRINL